MQLPSTRAWIKTFGLLAILLGLYSSHNSLLADITPVEAATLSPQTSTTAPATSNTLRFAIIGDFGENGAEPRSVADLVKSWQPEFITTVGDNNYPVGSAETIDPNIGQYYHEYIYPYKGIYTTPVSTITENRFWPALGNHDWLGLSCVGQTCSGPYFDYFTLPGNERYYDIVRGPVHFFFLDSDDQEPDGITPTSAQARWLHDKLAAAQERWKLVFMHHPPYSSGLTHGPQPLLQWPYKAWGADAVLTGHEHVYERSTVDGLPYFVTGLGGRNERSFGRPRVCSEVHYNEDFGAMLVEANSETITFQFMNVSNQVIDTYTLPAPATDQNCITTRVKQGADDVEEGVITGTISVNSGDLELTRDVAKARAQIVGIRFQQVTIPPGAQIITAALELTNNKNHDEPTSLVIHGAAVDNAPVFNTAKFGVSTLPQTVAAVPWADVDPWLDLGYVQQTPDVTAIVQEIVNRPRWQPGNAMTFIISGDGLRTVTAYESNPDKAPALLVKYRLPQSKLYLPLVNR